MDPALKSLLAKPYPSPNAVVVSLTALEKYFIKRRDRRAVFVSAYCIVSKTIRQWMAGGRFHDKVWLTAYMLAFGNLYRQALLDFELGRGSVPGVWQVAFATAKQGGALAVQDLVLGIHAHVNRDLAFALEMVGIDGDRASRQADHNLVNQILDQVTDDMQDRISELYSRGLTILDHLVGRLDEELASFSIRAARDQAWNRGVELVNAKGTPHRDEVAAEVDRTAKMLTGVFLAPNSQHPWLVGALRAVESHGGWLPALKK